MRRNKRVSRAYFIRVAFCTMTCTTGAFPASLYKDFTNSGHIVRGIHNEVKSEMKKRLIAIALIFVMVSAFTMVSTVSAKEGYWNAGESGIVQKRQVGAPQDPDYKEFGHSGGNAPSVTHIRDDGEVLNINMNNPNGDHPA